MGRGADRRPFNCLWLGSKGIHYGAGHVYEEPRRSSRASDGRPTLRRERRHTVLVFPALSVKAHCLLIGVFRLNILIFIKSLPLFPSRLVHIPHKTTRQHKIVYEYSYLNASCSYTSSNITVVFQ